MKRIKFILTMPNVGSWNGKWSREKDEFSVIRRVKEKKIKELEIPKNFYYDFKDGWGANVEMRFAKLREKATNNFAGYDWMIDSILDKGKILLKN